MAIHLNKNGLEWGGTKPEAIRTGVYPTDRSRVGEEWASVEKRQAK